MMLKMFTSKVKEAAEKWEKRPKRGRLMGSLLADEDANELQGFANDIREALQMFKVSEFSSCEHTLLISMMYAC